MPSPNRLLLVLFIFRLSSSYVMPNNVQNDALDKHQTHKLSLGAIIDYNSRAGKEEKIAMDMAIRDFYGHVSHRPTLLVKNSHGDPIRAASSAKTLIKKHEVRAIIGLGTWQETVFVAQFGNKSKVPILSLANEVPVWASSHWPFLVNAVRSQFAQWKAVASIIQSWQWRKVNIIYEDNNSAFTGIIPYITTALQEVDSQINDLLPLPPLPSHNSLSNKLKKLKDKQCRVFIVDTSVALGATIFMEAKKLGMMEKEFVWITTDAITNYVDSLTTSSVISSMQGVLGIKGYFSRNGKRFKDFQSRFRIMFRLKYRHEPHPEAGIFALQAYDAVWAVALAMQGKVNWKHVPNSTEITPSVKISGQKLLSKILESNFEGLTGKFSFKEGILAPAHIFQLVNVVGNPRVLGYWSEGLGFSVYIGKGRKYKKSMEILGQVLWPAGPCSVPKGWAVLPNGKRLKIGVPKGNQHKEFVNVTDDGGNLSVKGFSIDVFNATLNLLPYHLPYDFVPYELGTYDLLVKQVQLEEKNFDAVVGDTAILANRCEYAEFSQPYSDSGVQILVYKKPNVLKKAWLFKKPFTTLMWAATGVINVYNGFVVWLIERNHNPEFRGPIWNQMGTMLSLAFTTLFSIHGDRMHSNLSRMAMVVWLFVALVITQSFTASLTSFLTTQRLDATTIDVDTLKRTGAKVGCDANSFVVKYLEVVLGFQPDKIVEVHSGDDYPQALKSGEIAAAFLEVPYVKVFLAKHCEGFTTSKQTFKVGGFGFVFPKSSPYLPDISEAVLKVSETGKLRELEYSLTSSHNCSASESEEDHDSLGVNNFWGLFVLTGGMSTISLLLFIFRQVCQNRYEVFSEAQQQHDPHEDEEWMFGPEMEIQNRFL